MRPADPNGRPAPKEQGQSGLIEEAVNTLVTERLLQFREVLEEDYGLERLPKATAGEPAS